MAEADSMPTEATSSRAAPRLVIAAPQGRSGKTTISLGLCASLAARGIAVQPFKKGPDYIDPSWLAEAAGKPCRSLDPFFYPDPQALTEAFLQAVSEGAEEETGSLALVEGNHGLYDSYDEAGMGSTAALARALQAPVLLVVNAARLGRSAAALVQGYLNFEPETPIAAVVLNNVAQGRHETRLRQAIEGYCHIPVVGAVPRGEALAIPDRHLGLVPRAENQALLPVIAACQSAVERYLDLEAILAIARSAPPMKTGAANRAQGNRPTRCRLGVIRDQAFTFYYPENLQALEQAGAELVFIDALHDPGLPAVDALYIGGGFPEIFMEQLAANTSLRSAIRQAVEDGLPVYAECGGLMYLSRRIIWNDRSADMVGVLPCEVKMMDKPQGHGYVIAQVDRSSPFFVPGTVLRGHEFHQSRLIWLDRELPTAYCLSRGNGAGNGRDGLLYRNVLASYTHLHTGGAPTWAEALVAYASSA